MAGFHLSQRFYPPSSSCGLLLLQSVLPFFVATKMTRIRKPTLDKPTPERYVAAELGTVGLQSQTNGYFPHAVMVRAGMRRVDSYRSPINPLTPT